MYVYSVILALPTAEYLFTYRTIRNSTYSRASHVRLTYQSAYLGIPVK